MTQTSAASAAPLPVPETGPPAAPSLGRGVRALRAVAVASCLPYITLKVLWIAGNRVGIPDDSTLLDDRIAMAVANSVSVVLDAAVVVLALLLTRPWGRRVPAWLLALPMWVAAGLLAPIMTGYPLQLAGSVVDGSRPAPSNSEPFLDAWVFAVVYSGFILQGLTLGTLFVLYARRRWGHLWRGPLGDPRTTTTARATAAAGATLALLPGVMHLLWATGATTGLSADRIAERSTDFHLVEGVHALFAVVAVAGTLLLAFPFRAAGRLSPRIPLATAWVGSGTLGCWGGFLFLTTLLPTDPDQRAAGPMVLTYAVSMVAGFLLFGSVVSTLRRRAV
ncbi:hypothetical protein ACFT9I_10495 [Streptomyces sp. NPDC057137]|uniref:hypothetical protein n=1 Tax=Streptomyces sp. NPDC057137 TaxID=3346030 RepID=UPI00362D4A4E